ncbi:MAG: YhbD family protein [Peptococcaceae bacterium]|nr:YhbD family protein [Peptococcaceae bacterium]
MDDLISKKELLETTGISYGALYRYKRKNLIPDDWFIRKSTFTGQETFFPRDLILRRIEQIQELKEEVSLDGMHGMLTGDIPEDLTLSYEVFMPHISATLAEVAKKYVGDSLLGFKELMALLTADGAMKSGKMALAECEQVLQTLLGFRIPAKGDKLLGYRSGGVFFCLVAVGEVWTGADAHKIVEIDLAERISALKVFVRDKNDGGGENS